MSDFVDTPEDNYDSGSDKAKNQQRTWGRLGMQTQAPSRYAMAVKDNKNDETPKRKKTIELADKDELELLCVIMRTIS